MFTEKRGMIVVAVVLLTCGLLLSNANVVVEARPLSTIKVTTAKISTALTISAPSSTQVKQSFSVTGKLTANNAALSKSTVSLQRLNGNTWTTIASQTTTGTYSFSRTETTANTYQYRTTYTGSAPYASSTSQAAKVTVTAATISTALTISAPSSTQVKQSFSVTGKLTANNAALSKSTVSLQRLNGNTWTTIASQTTTGTYSFSRTETTANTYQYRTTYTGSAPYASSTSQAAKVTVTAATISTALTISAPSSTQVKQSFSVTGKLTANNAALSKSTVS